MCILLYTPNSILQSPSIKYDLLLSCRISWIIVYCFICVVHQRLHGCLKAAWSEKNNNHISRNLSLPVEIVPHRSVHVCLCTWEDRIWSDRAQHIAMSNNLLSLSSLYSAGAVSDTNTDRMCAYIGKKSGCALQKLSV